MNDVPHGEMNDYQVPNHVRASDFGLSPQEFFLLRALLEHKYITHTQAIKILWPHPGQEPDAPEGVIRVLISAIRKKIQESHSITTIKNMHGGGWFLGEQQAEPPCTGNIEWMGLELSMLPIGGTLTGDLGEAYLTKKEVALAKKLIIARGKSTPLTDSTQSIYAHIKNLRKKLHEASSTFSIRPVYGEGYILECA